MKRSRGALAGARLLRCEPARVDLEHELVRDQLSGTRRASRRSGPSRARSGGRPRSSSPANRATPGEHGGSCEAGTPVSCTVGALQRTTLAASSERNPSPADTTGVSSGMNLVGGTSRRGPGATPATLVFWPGSAPDGTGGTTPARLFVTSTSRKSARTPPETRSSSRGARRGRGIPPRSSVLSA